MSLNTLDHVFRLQLLWCLPLAVKFAECIFLVVFAFANTFEFAWGFSVCHWKLELTLSALAFNIILHLLAFSFCFDKENKRNAD